jgi:hypothetical protein
MDKPAKKLGFMHLSEMNKHVKITRLRNEYGVYKDDIFYGIRYYEIDNESKHYLYKKFLPINLYGKFDILLMIINYHDILPHTDSDVKTVINYYIKGANAVTHFWKLKPDIIDNKLKMDNQTDGSIYDLNTLKHNYSFKAKNNEYWILNVKEIHSVVGAKDIRLAFCFQSELPYNEVLSAFN